MSPQTVGLIIGGFLPAAIYGLVNIIAKVVAKDSLMTPGLYLVLGGIGVTIAGALFFFVIPQRGLPANSTIMYALGFGFLWAFGSGLVLIALMRFGTPLSKLVPLYNLNTLVAVLLSLVLFAEWQQVSIVKLLLGTVFVVVGATLVALA